VNGVVKKNATNQDQRQYGGDLSERHEADAAQDQPAYTPGPDLLRGDGSRGYRPFPAMLPIEIRVEGIIQEHTADVQTGGAKTKQREAERRPTITEQPCGETIGPDRWEVRHAPQDQERAPFASRGSYGKGHWRLGKSTRDEKAIRLQRNRIGELTSSGSGVTIVKRSELPPFRFLVGAARGDTTRTLQRVDRRHSGS